MDFNTWLTATILGWGAGVVGLVFALRSARALGPNWKRRQRLWGGLSILGLVATAGLLVYRALTV